MLMVVQGKIQVRRLVIRDFMGVVFKAEPYSIGISSSVYAEAMALLRGLQLCSDHDLYQIEVETDNKLMLKCLTSSIACPWHISSIIAASKVLLQNHAMSLHHIYREANTAADFLACYASTSQQSSYFTTASSLPRTLRGLILLDQLGCPNIRLRSQIVS